MRPLALSAALLVAAAPLRADPIPDAVAAMIDAVAANPDQLKIVADAARKTNPAAVAEIDARLAAIDRDRAAAEQARYASQGTLDGWSGSGEVGAFASSGNTSNTGIAIAARATKRGLKWRHTARAVIDYQRERGRTSKERYVLGYEGNRTISDNAYALVAGSYESDRFSGFNHRFAETVGLGYKVVDTARVRVAFEGGPALRQTRFTDGNDRVNFAARGATDLRWTVTPRWTLTNNSSVYYDDFNISFQALTAATGKLYGALSARASVQYNSESNPPPGRRNADTTSRMTLVYSF